MHWINPPVILTGKTVTLIPLEKEHFEMLLPVSKDKRIWEHYVFDGNDTAEFLLAMENTIADREKGTQYPFLIIYNNDKQFIGSTRFMDIQPQHKKLEIGGTWLHPNHWATQVNIECKLLLLTHAFETLKAVRVQLKTDENNIRSRKAIEKIGGRFEGILRNDMLRNNGTKRSSAYFSITDDEWPAVKNKLQNAITLYENSH